MLQGEFFQNPGGASGFYDYQIEQSLRIGSGDTLRRTPSSDGNRTVWTFSAWIKRATLDDAGGQYQILESGASGNQDTRLFYNFKDGGTIQASSGNTNYGASSERFEDVTGWMHLVLKHTGGVTTAYHNGTSFHTWSISGNTAINKSGLAHGIACRGGSGSGAELQGYIAEVHLTDGTAYEPTQFAEEKNGVWIPKDPSGTSYGTNGVHLKFEDASDLGNDSSGNNNDYTSNMGADHQVVDSPTFGS
tara:strand:+ start:42 stop:782 length:741 start_codon:yes stop_codon:yes gene_type:complete